MKIILHKNTRLYAKVVNDLTQLIIADKELVFDIKETSIVQYKHSEDTRRYQYKKPYPVYNGMLVTSIEWDIKNTNETIVKD